MKQRRLDNVQALRGLAAVLVVIEHSFDQLRNHPVPGIAPFTTFVGHAWGNGVDIFFIISGFIMFYLTHDHFAERGYPAEFIKRRIVRVVPTYWLFTTAMVAVALAQPGAVNHGLGGPWHVVSSYLFIPSAQSDGLLHPVFGLGWTLNYEFFFYAAFAIALMAPRAVALPGLFAAFVLFALLHPFAPPGPLAFWSDPMILEFLAGILVAMAFLRGISFGGLGAMAALLIVGAALAVILPGLLPGANRVVTSGIPSLIMAAGMVLTADRRWWRPMILIGDASYAIYLSHPFALNLATAVWRKLPLPRQPQLYSVALIAAAIAGGVIVYLVVERPLVKALRRRFEPRRNLIAA